MRDGNPVDLKAIRAGRLPFRRRFPPLCQEACPMKGWWLVEALLRNAEFDRDPTAAMTLDDLRRALGRS